MILALATADATTRLWLFTSATAPKPLATLEWESGRSLSDGLLGQLIHFLGDHHAALTDLTGIVIFSGPGSFTSLRIGHAVANALADSLSIPIVGARDNHWQTTGRQQL